MKRMRTYAVCACGLLSLCSLTAGYAAEKPGPKANFRSYTSLSRQELQKIRRDRKDVILVTNKAPTKVQGIIIRIDSTEGVYFLDLCTGKLFNVLGSVVYNYPGEWGGSGCN